MNKYQQDKKALGSKAIVTIIAPSPPDEIYKRLWQLIEEFENRFSRFKPDSELSKFNARAGNYVKISSDFLDILRACQNFSKKTDGLFNPFILPKLQEAGYKGSWPNPSNFDPSLDLSSRSITTAKSLVISGEKAHIPTDTAIELGGIGKGYLLDVLAKYLIKNKVNNFWISLGGDIIVSGFDDNNQPWQVEIQDARSNDDNLMSIVNDNGKILAVATSGTTKRMGGRGNKRWHHIIDPRDGNPSGTNILMATIVCRSGVAADVYAKAQVIDDSFARDSKVRDDIMVCTTQEVDNISKIINTDSVSCVF